ncbi:adenosine monophosphate-protein transferase [Bradyrhizobium guangdongense]|uniref:Fic/DOC family protein n=1 Tax=Bradyrhizobium guangdongense TaxID=1325090 RepID=UPI0011263F78|nr:Fic family protein [Bradyrhizobium guangdongense]TPQ29145.1 adenosine monophosphate-protein transferase [Bradyrhizobium guangdongense]
MYDAVEDPYCYPGTTVLKNKLDIRTQQGLDAFEAEIAAQRAEEPLPVGRLTYSHYRAIHRHLFQDVYAWAGKIRTVRISKGGSMFCYPESIDREMSKLFRELLDQNHLRDTTPDGFAGKAAHFLAELNAIHPFREGNGRTQLTFLALLAEKAGHPLAMEHLVPEIVLQAMVDSFVGNEKPLARVIRSLLKSGS